MNFCYYQTLKRNKEIGPIVLLGLPILFSLIDIKYIGLLSLGADQTAQSVDLSRLS